MKVPGIVLAATYEQHLRVLKEYAEFWKIPYSTGEAWDENSVVFLAGQIPRESAHGPRTIVSPSGFEEARSIAQRLGLDVISRETLLRVPVSKQATASITILTFQFQGRRVENLLSMNGTGILQRVQGTGLHLLSVDLVSNYFDRLYGGLQDPPSLRFRLATMLPFSYNTIPSFLRNRFFKSGLRAADIAEEKLGPIECLRTIFLAGLLTVVHSPIPRIGFWRRGKSHSLAITHDVETRVGLESGTRQLLEVEEKLRVRSTWNVPSARYPISRKDLDHLANAGDLGGHDTRHDGRLVFLNARQKLARLKTCKDELEMMCQSEVQGFRSPLLQHSRDLLTAIGRAGFRFDSSVPSWEVLSPTSLRSHGVGTVFPFSFDGCLEIPVSLHQDHQLIRVMGLKPSEAVERLHQISRWISGLGGACVLLVHPDYEFASPEYKSEYERLLRGLIRSRCDVMTLREMADWWRFRSSAGLEVVDSQVKLKQQGHLGELDDLQIELVKEYGEDGFLTETMR